jgi:hypothetical protein
MDRRDFTKVMGVVVAGMTAGSAFAADEKKPADAKAPKHICKGHNECKGQGGCAADAAKHDCAKKNECGGIGQEQLQGQGWLQGARRRGTHRQGCEELLQGQGRLQELGRERRITRGTPSPGDLVRASANR